MSGSFPLLQQALLWLWETTCPGLIFMYMNVAEVWGSTGRHIKLPPALVLPEMKRNCCSPRPAYIWSYIYLVISVCQFAQTGINVEAMCCYGPLGTCPHTMDGRMNDWLQIILWLKADNKYGHQRVLLQGWCSHFQMEMWVRILTDDQWEFRPSSWQCQPNAKWQTLLSLGDMLVLLCPLVSFSPTACDE